MSATANGRILHAAIELMAERGIAGITMSAVASAANVARQTLYNHYGDVESIIYAATASHQEQSFEQLQAILETIDSPSGRLEHLVRHSASLATHGHPPIRGAFSGEIQQLIERHNAAMLGVVADALRDGVEQERFRPDLDIEHDAVLVLRAIEAVGELVATEPEALSTLVATTVRSVRAMVEV
jgi:AcrR family transcriptional regulator